MNNLLEEDARIIDAFIAGSSDFLTGQNLRLEGTNLKVSLIERSTAIVIATIDFSSSVPYIRMRMNFVGYESLPAYLEARGFTLCQPKYKGVLEFRSYKLDSYTTYQGNINKLWKSFRRLVTMNKFLKILHENNWCEVIDLIHEDFTYVIKMKGRDLIIAVPDQNMIWAEPIDKPTEGIDKSIWATGLITSEILTPPASSFPMQTNRKQPDNSEGSKFKEKLEALATNLAALTEYFDRLSSVIVTDKKFALQEFQLLMERVSFLEGSINNRDLLLEEYQENNSDEIFCEEQSGFNLTTDSSRFGESVGSATSLMMPLN